MKYEERYTLQERYEHLIKQQNEDLATLRRYTRALGRVLGPQKCPKCDETLRFYPEPSLADPVHLILFACPTVEETYPGYKFSHYCISDFTEEMIGKDG